MRTGVLADDHAKREGFIPLDVYTHENLYARPMPERHGVAGGKKRRQRRVHRPRAPYMLHAEMAQQMLPLNPIAVAPAFGDKLEEALTSRPSKRFSEVVARHDHDHPKYATSKGMRAENAYFAHTLGLNIEQTFGHRTAKLRLKRFTQTLIQLHDRQVDRHKNDPEEVTRINDALKTTLEEMAEEFKGGAAVKPEP